ncbi:hypothetical protein [Acidithiobacillus thiooxidans]|uniref:hypothetical protein n=1 Tax=Acidithiobacillus thiooxidans TaxID=930 RepID=UPI0035666225|nr:hypothetical protein [Acidithiobacillus sp.]
MSFPTFPPKRSRLAASLMAALFCATPLLAQAATAPVQTLAYPAGSAQTRTIRLPWSSTHTSLPTLHTQQVPTGVTLQLRGWTPHRHALRVAVSIPARLAPGLYAAQFTLTPAHGPSEPVSLRLAIQALYIGLSGNGGHDGIVAESTDGKILTGLSRRLTAGIPEQGKLGVSGIGYNPLNETLWVYAGGSEYITNVATLNGQFLPSPIPRRVISSAVPSFIDWAGGRDFLWARENSWMLTSRGAIISRIRDNPALDSDGGSLPSSLRIIPSAATADPQTGTVYLSNGDEQIHSSPWIYEFTRQGQYLGHFTDPQFGTVMALAYNPWNQEIYVMGRIHGTPSVAIHVFTAQGQPVALPAGAFPGGRLQAITQTILTANPLNGQLYYLNRRIIDVYSPNGRLLRTLPSPAGAHNITFAPGYLHAPTAPAVATGAPTALTSETAAPQPLAAPSAAHAPQACPPGYRCVPKSEAAAKPAPSSPVPSFNQSVNRADNTVDNVDNLASSISDLAQAFR